MKSNGVSFRTSFNHDANESGDGTTLDLYVHPLESQHQDAATRIGTALYG